jgi:hypothetical protein
MFSIQQNRRTRRQNRFCPEVSGRGNREKGRGGTKMYIHVSKCKSDKRRKEKNKAYKKMYIKIICKYYAILYKGLEHL